MPCKLQFSLAGPPPASPYQHHAGLHRLVLEWVGLVNPALAAASHDPRKPYTISPLWRGEDGRFSFVVGALAEGVAGALQAGCERYGPTIGLGPMQYRVEGVAIEREVSWPELAGGPAATVFPVRLLSPTRTTEPGGAPRALPAPTAESYFASWLAQWNRWAPDPALAIDKAMLAVVKEHVQVATCGVRTVTVRLFGGYFTGYVGELTFEAGRRLPGEARQRLATLARFANYCGTGKATSGGMGQTECRPGGEGGVVPGRRQVRSAASQNQ